VKNTSGKIFIHIGAPKSASTYLQYYFHNEKNINFLGLIRDHENFGSKPKYDDDFHLYCRHIIKSYDTSKIKNKISKKKINLISDEGFIVSEYTNFKKIIQRVIKTFPVCEFILVLRDPVETILSWQAFHIRGIKNTPLDIKSYLKSENTKNVIDLINYKKRIDYIKSLKKNKLHIVNYNGIKQNKTHEIFKKILGYKKTQNFKVNNLPKQNVSIYFIKKLYIIFPWLKKLKFILPRFIINFIKNLLYKLNVMSKIKQTTDEIEVRYLNKLFAKEVKYYKSLFKGKDYFTIN
jgi:hypothetical protein